jgi:hypothetical protein
MSVILVLAWGLLAVGIVCYLGRRELAAIALDAMEQARYRQAVREARKDEHPEG